MLILEALQPAIQDLRLLLRTAERSAGKGAVVLAAPTPGNPLASWDAVSYRNFAGPCGRPKVRGWVMGT